MSDLEYRGKFRCADLTQNCKMLPHHPPALVIKLISTLTERLFVVSALSELALSQIRRIEHMPIIHTGKLNLPLIIASCTCKFAIQLGMSTDFAMLCYVRN